MWYQPCSVRHSTRSVHGRKTLAPSKDVSKSAVPQIVANASRTRGSSRARHMHGACPMPWLLTMPLCGSGSQSGSDHVAGSCRRTPLPGTASRKSQSDAMRLLTSSGGAQAAAMA